MFSYFFSFILSVEILFSHVLQKKTNGAPNGFYAEIDWDRYVSV